MARKGENIHKRRSDGRWEARCWHFSREEGKWKYKYLYSATYEEAKRKKEAFIERVKNLEDESDRPPQTVLPENVFFTEIAEEWLKRVRSRKKLSTYVKYEKTYRRHIEAPLQGIRLTEVTKVLLQEKLFGSLSSDSLRMSACCVINQVLDMAGEKYSLTLPKVKKPAAAKSSRTVEPLSHEELAKLIPILYDNMDSYKMGVLFNLYTGLRLGETAALKWSDIDFGNGTVSVNSAVQRLPVEGAGTKTALVVAAPKTACSNRKIPVSQKILTMMSDFRKDGEYVFSGKKPLEPRTMENHFARMLEEAGVEHHRYHALRHTFATNSIEAGTDVKCLSELLGHSNVGTTMNLYVHPSMDMKRKYMEGMDKFYSQFLP